MTSALLRRRAATADGAPASAWGHVVRTAAALAAGMGVGRFVYTPILPLMHAQAGLAAAAGADLATANYAGYLVGALAGIAVPRLTRSSWALRGPLLILTATLAAMPLTHSTAVWLALRLGAGVASALIFVAAVGSLLGHLRGHPAHLPGWAFGGIGAGIALSGLLVLILRSVAGWQAAWWASAGLAVLLTAASWNLTPEPAPRPADRDAPAAATGARRRRRSRGDGSRAFRRRRRETGSGTRRRFAVLFVSYTLEGVGYIIAGTFLVAAIEQNSPGWIGGGAWVLVGLAAVPSPALWTWLGRRRSHPGLLLTALAVQAAGIALPALVGGVGAALASALLFGATFIGVSMLALATGAHLGVPRAVALLTCGYSVGQILGPPAVTPFLQHGYRPALLIGAVVVLAAAAAAAVLRFGLPHRAPAPAGPPAG